MIVKIYSIHDQCAGVFGRPFMLPSEGIAVRAFTDQVNTKDGGDLNRHPEHFSLYELGQFDDSNGSFETHVEPKFIIAGNSVYQQTFAAQDGMENHLKSIIEKIEELL